MISNKFRSCLSKICYKPLSVIIYLIFSFLRNGCYAHKIKKIMDFNKDDYEILLYFNFLLTIYKNRSPAKFHNRPQLNAQSS